MNYVMETQNSNITKNVTGETVIRDKIDGITVITNLVGPLSKTDTQSVRKGVRLKRLYYISL